MPDERAAPAAAGESDEPLSPDEQDAERRMASEIYGLIVASSVLAAGSDETDIVHVAASVLVTLVVYWLAEGYAHVMAARHVGGQPIRWVHLMRELRGGWPLVSASFIPLFAVVIAAVVGASVDVAQTIGMVSATVMLFASGWIAGRHNGLTGLKHVFAALMAAGLGVVLIGLKTALH